MKTKMILKIKEEVEKQWNVGFLAVAKYPQWVANIVLVPKKDEKVRMCIDYRDLNRAIPKDNFPLPHIDMLIDNTTQHAFYSFMDGFSEYNRFGWQVTPFELKNVGATYQRAMVALFHDMMHKEVEVYMDDMIAKSRKPYQHVDNLRKLFENFKNTNSTKCIFEVKASKLLGFIVNEKGIEVDPDKVKAIRNMLAPRFIFN
ncbi:hypothetical protein CR513_58204, partial [Mucuna pruriens]